MQLKGPKGLEGRNQPMSMDFSSQKKKGQYGDKKLKFDKTGGGLNDSVQNTQSNTLIHDEAPFDDDFSPPRLDGGFNSSRMTETVLNTAV